MMLRWSRPSSVQRRARRRRSAEPRSRRGSQSESRAQLEATALTGLVLDPEATPVSLRGRAGRGGARGPAGRTAIRSPSYAARARAAAQPALPAPAPARTRSASSPSTGARLVPPRPRLRSLHRRRRLDRPAAQGDRGGLRRRLPPAERRGRAGPLPARPIARLVVRHPGGVPAGPVRRCPDLARRESRRSFRAAVSGSEDPHNAFAYFRLGSGQLAALRRAGKAWGVTINDLFLASLLLALSPLAAERRPGTPATRARGGVDRQHPRRFRRRPAAHVRAVPRLVPRRPSGARGDQPARARARRARRDDADQAATSCTCRPSWRSACRA